MRAFVYINHAWGKSFFLLLRAFVPSCLRVILHIHTKARRHEGIGNKGFTRRTKDTEGEEFRA